jgi:DNA invertase Pin-like site-specific DNA recombinase
MFVGYARTSTLDQVAGFEAQLRDLKAVGVLRLYQEQVSSVGERPQLKALLDYLREGDVLIVTKMDRLARSMRDLCSILATIESKGASLRILNMNVDTSTLRVRLVSSSYNSLVRWRSSSWGT